MRDWKSNPYLTQAESDTFNELAAHVLRDTLSCWKATRINGASASMVCDGNVSVELLRALDEVAKTAVGSAAYQARLKS